MLRPPTPEQVAYQDRVERIICAAQAVMQRQGRLIGAVDWDNGDMAMLPEPTAHTLRFLSGPADVVFSIPVRNGFGTRDNTGTRSRGQRRPRYRAVYSSE